MFSVRMKTNFKKCFIKCYFYHEEFATKNSNYTARLLYHQVLLVLTELQHGGENWNQVLSFAWTTLQEL